MSLESKALILDIDGEWDLAAVEVPNVYAFGGPHAQP